MYNELIKALRVCGNYEDREGCDEECPYIYDRDCPKRIMCDAAYALEAAEKRIEELEDEIKNLENAYIAELTQAHINVQRSAKIYREWYEAVGRKKECIKNDLE